MNQILDGLNLVENDQNEQLLKQNDLTDFNLMEERQYLFQELKTLDINLYKKKILHILIFSPKFCWIFFEI